MACLRRLQGLLQGVKRCNGLSSRQWAGHVTLNVDRRLAVPSKPGTIILRRNIDNAIFLPSLDRNTR